MEGAVEGSTLAGVTPTGDYSGQDNIAALALKSKLGVCYRSAWLQATAHRENIHELREVVRIDDGRRVRGRQARTRFGEQNPFRSGGPDARRPCRHETIKVVFRFL